MSSGQIHTFPAVRLAQERRSCSRSWQDTLGTLIILCCPSSARASVLVFVSDPLSRIQNLDEQNCSEQSFAAVAAIRHVAERSGRGASEAGSHEYQLQMLDGCRRKTRGFPAGKERLVFEDHGAGCENWRPSRQILGRDSRLQVERNGRMRKNWYLGRTV